MKVFARQHVIRELLGHFICTGAITRRINTQTRSGQARCYFSRTPGCAKLKLSENLSGRITQFYRIKDGGGLGRPPPIIFERQILPQ